MPRVVNRNVVLKNNPSTRKTKQRILTEKITKQVEGDVRVPVKSSNLKLIEYSKETKDLTITFLKGNKKYVYADVPHGVYMSLLKANSKGEYFHKFIRFRYNYSQVSTKVR